MRATISIPPHLAYGDDEALPSTPGAPDVQVAVVNMMQGRVEAVCKRLGWSPSTLQKKISLTTNTHILSIAELQMLQHATGDITPTQVLAAAEGYVCIRVSPGVAGSVSEGIADLMVAVADLARDAHHASARGKPLTRSDLNRADMLAGEVMGKTNALVACMRMQPTPVVGGGA